MSASTSAMPEAMPSVPAEDRDGNSRFTPRTLVWAVIPLLLLAIVLAFIVRTNGGVDRGAVPPIETLSVQRVVLPKPGLIELHVVNDGPDPITIAQVLVDD